MDGAVWLDEDYHSGVEGCPGTRFVIDLHVPAVPLEEQDHEDEEDKDKSTPPTEVDSESDELDSDRRLEDRELPENVSVLFTDDDMVVRKLFCRAVRKVAPTWDVQEASSGETAVRLATSEENRFDLIFMGR